MKKSLFSAVLIMAIATFLASCAATNSGGEPGMPVITMDPKSPTNAKFVTFSGTKDSNTAIICNGKEVVKNNYDTSFSFAEDLLPGDNQFIIYARKPGNIYSKPWYGLAIRDNNTPKDINIVNLTAKPAGPMFIVSGPAGSAKGGARVVARRIIANMEYSSQARADGSWDLEVPASANECLAISVVDLAENSSKDAYGCLCAAASYPEIKCN